MEHDSEVEFVLAGEDVRVEERKGGRGKGEAGWKNINVCDGRVQGLDRLPNRSVMSFRSLFPLSRLPIPYAVNELPQPHPPVAFGFLKVKPEPCMDDT